MSGYSPQIFDLYAFEYTTVQRLRDEGLTDSSTYPDATVRKLIRRFSKVVNRATDQWFWPIEQKVRIDGTGSPLVSSPSSVPILDLRSVTFYSEEASRDLLASEYRVGSREVYVPSSPPDTSFYLRSSHNRFPAGLMNVILDGTFGWLENRPYVSFDQVPKVSTTLSQALTSGATTATLVSAAGIPERAVLVFRTGSAGTSYAGHAIVTAVNTGTGVVTFDPVSLNQSSLPIGANVAFYGCVPEPVEDAVVRLVIKFKDKLASAASQSTDKLDRIIKERTDNYSYELSDTAAAASVESITGDTEADRLLHDYCRPNVVSAV